MLKTKRTIEPVLACQPSDRRERHDNAGDGNAEHLNYVALFVMANFMREYGFQLRLGELSDQCVEQHDFSKTCKAGEEGVGVGRAFTAVQDVDAARRQMGRLRLRNEAGAQGSSARRRERV